MSTPTEPTSAYSNREIRLISHSSLFYWWPVWVFGFFMAIWTSMENDRMAVVPHDATMKTSAVESSDGKNTVRTYTLKTAYDLPKQSKRAVEHTDQDNPGDAFPIHISQHAWLGSLFVTILLFVIVITNVPLRGLWSFLVIIMLIVVALFIHVLHGWDDILERLGNLRVYINLAGYLTISTFVFIVWCLATFLFDRRSYVVFTPGQIRVCEHIGDSVRTYDTMGVTMQKQRDDLFRHYILGFGSGDLILKTSGADSHEIKMPNILGIGWQLRAVEDLLRERSVTTG